VAVVWLTAAQMRGVSRRPQPRFGHSLSVQPTRVTRRQATSISAIQESWTKFGVSYSRTTSEWTMHAKKKKKQEIASFLPLGIFVERRVKCRPCWQN
jgi:hypothetical protein